MFSIFIASAYLYFNAKIKIINTIYIQIYYVIEYYGGLKVKKIGVRQGERDELNLNRRNAS